MSNQPTERRACQMCHQPIMTDESWQLDHGKSYHLRCWAGPKPRPKEKQNETSDNHQVTPLLHL